MKYLKHETIPQTYEQIQKKQIENGTLKFIKDIENYLSK